MSCCGGSCSCGKGNQTPVQENLAMVQMSTVQGMMSTHDFTKGLESLVVNEAVVEVRFKNNRKAFYRNVRGDVLLKDDRVVVEVPGGHDLGTVSLTGDAARRQFELKAREVTGSALNQIYRKATQMDQENWLKAKRRERDVLLQARQIARDLHLDMSISDVEFQGDGKKVTLYYTADGRVDFRELIRKYASAFRVKIEMKQIGARQSAARVGGIGSCGRELCCSTWKNDMKTVKTDAARAQNLSLIASKLAGQCGKLKCCLNYELATYLEAWEHFPSELIELDSDRGVLVPLQPDLLKGIVHYTLASGKEPSRFIIPIEQIKVFIEMNKKGKRIQTASIDSIKTSIRNTQSIFN